jgi:hypothetical protein
MPGPEGVLKVGEAHPCGSKRFVPLLKVGLAQQGPIQFPRYVRANLVENTPVLSGKEHSLEIVGLHGLLLGGNPAVHDPLHLSVFPLPFPSGRLGCQVREQSLLFLYEETVVEVRACMETRVEPIPVKDPCLQGCLPKEWAYTKPVLCDTYDPDWAGTVSDQTGTNVTVRHFISDRIA